jgi:hypothetical protein
MGNAWETHGKHMEDMGWPGLGWPGLAWAGLALGGSSMTEFLRRVLYNKYNGISMGIALEPPTKKHTTVR